MTSKTTNAETTTYSHTVPEGYEKRTSDIAGFWDMKAAINFIPQSAKLFDSNIEPSKLSALIIGKVIGPHKFISDDGEVTELGDGETVGVWAKPGMSVLKDLAGVPVYMYLAGELDTGKPNPMKVFEIFSKGKGTRLLVTDDFRKKSQAASHFLLEGLPSRTATPGSNGSFEPNSQFGPGGGGESNPRF